jgi:hypothetical protein
LIPVAGKTDVAKLVIIEVTKGEQRPSTIPPFLK